MKHRKTKLFALQFLAYMSAFVPSYYFYWNTYDNHKAGALILLLVGSYISAAGGSEVKIWFNKKYPQS